MGKYVVRRIVMSIPILLGITVIVFALSNLLPGDPIDFLIPPEGGVAQETLDALRERLGLHRPAPVRYVLWLKEALRGNLGYRFKTYDPVLWSIGNRLYPTLLLMGAALILGVVIGVPLGLLSALRQYSWIDFLLTGVTFVGISLPAFFAGIVGLYVFSVRLSLFPTGGMMRIGAQQANVWDVLHHLVLPASILSFNYVATIMRYTRSSMLEVIRQDYVVVARAKGLNEWSVTIRHALRNALMPVITVLGLSLPSIIGGAVFIESVFGWPGMGTLFLDAVTSRDYPLIMGITLLAAVGVLVINICVDVAYGWANPRIRFE